MFRNCAKYVLVILNIAIFISGGALFVAGVMMLVESGLLDSSVVKLLNMIEYDSVKIGLVFQAATFLMIISGGVIMVMAIVGSCGAWKKIKCCLLIFVFFVVAMIVVEGAVVGLWMFSNGRSGEWLRGNLKTLMEDYAGPEATDDISDGFNQLFMKGRCCGVSNYSDFETIPSFWFGSNSGAEKIPATCCQGVDTIQEIADTINSNCTKTPVDYYSQGCHDIIEEKVDLYILLTSLVCSLALIVKVAAIVLACIVLDRTKNRIRSMAIGDVSANSKPPPPYKGIDTVMKTRRGVKN